MSFKRKPSRYLVAVDGGDSGHRAFEWTMENTTKKDRIIVGYVQSFEDPNSIVYGMPGNLTLKQQLDEDTLLSTEVDNFNGEKERETVIEVETFGKNKAEQILHHYGQLCKDADRKCELLQIETPSGAPSSVGGALCNYMETGADSLVLGSRNLPSLARSVLGSVGMYCLNNCSGTIINVKE